MTKLDNVSQTAKDFCREALTEARELQAQIGVSRDEQCKLPVTFNRFRSVERFEALTAEFDAIAVMCREKLIAKTTERPMSALEQLELANALNDARKRCERALENFSRLVRKHGGKNVPNRSFKGLALEELRRLENVFSKGALALASLSVELAPALEPEPETIVTTIKVVAIKAEPESIVEEAVVAAPTKVVETKVEAPKAPQPEYGEARRQAAKEYKELLMRLVRLEGNFERYGYRSNELYREQPLALTKRELRELTASIKTRIDQLAPPKAVEPKLTPAQLRHAREQKLQSKYLQLQRSGRAHQPFGVWMQSRSERPMRRAG